MSAQEKPIKVLLSRSHLDSHQRGIVTVAAALGDAGMEVMPKSVTGGLVNPAQPKKE